MAKKTAGLREAGVLPEPGPQGAESVEQSLAAAVDHPDDRTIGELLAAVVELARTTGVDPENALRTVAVRRRDAARVAEAADLT